VLLHYGRDRAGAEASLAAIKAVGGEGRLLTSTRPTALHAGKLLEADMAAHGTYYGTVLNAGITNAFPMSDEDWHTVLDTNLNGFYNVQRRIVIPWYRLVAGAHCHPFIGNRLDWQPWTGELHCGNGWRYAAGRCGTRWQTKTADAGPVHGPLHAPPCVTRVSHGRGFLARITVRNRDDARGHVRPHR